MSVSINLWALIALCGYAVLGTGVFLALLCGASRQGDKNGRIISLLKTDRDHYKKKCEELSKDAAVSKVEIDGLVAARTQLEKDLDVSQQHMASRDEHITELREINLFLTTRYLQSSNVLAWWRMTLRELYPDMYRAVNECINNQKMAASSLAKDTPAAGVTSSHHEGREEGTKVSEGVESVKNEVAELWTWLKTNNLTAVVRFNATVPYDFLISRLQSHYPITLNSFYESRKRIVNKSVPDGVMDSKLRGNDCTVEVTSLNVMDVGSC